jgi:hypothetical protein
METSSRATSAGGGLLAVTVTLNLGVLVFIWAAVNNSYHRWVYRLLCFTALL